jgi:hypothetical protein
VVHCAVCTSAVQLLYSRDFSFIVAVCSLQE